MKIPCSLFHETSGNLAIYSSNDEPFPQIGRDRCGEVALEEALKNSQTKIHQQYSVQIDGEVILPELAFDRMTGMLGELVKGGSIIPDV